MKARILETFQSIQGEGKYAGVKQVFVRFFECNMHCTWCDTPHSIGDTSSRYNEFSLDELLKNIDELWQDSHSVSLTGGEPLIQSEFIKTLLPHLKKMKRPAHLETNGVFPKALEELIDDLDVIAMDIKLPSSTKCEPFWDEHEEFLKIGREKDIFIKTVVTSDTDQADINRAIELVSKVDPNILFILQPNSYELQNGVMKRCLEFHELCAKDLKNVRVLPQMHKMMKVR